MQNQTTRNARIIMSAFVILAGIVLIAILPSSGLKAMDGVLKGAYMKISMVPDPAPLMAAPTLVKFFYPFWSGLGLVAGTALLLLAIPIYRGERWGRPLALGMLAIPAIAGAYMLGPIMFFAPKAITISIAFMLVGLIPYFVVLLYEQSSGKEKLRNFFIFTLLGVTAAYNFGNGHSSLRQLLSSLAKDAQAIDHSFAIGVVANWVGVILIIIGIPLLAARARSGWWTTSIGTLAMFFGTGQLFLGHTSTVEFIVGTSMALVTFILLITPSLGGAIVNEEVERKIVPPLEQTNQAL